jgi:glycosyltransferase involved in cell wall biosynthesis
MKIGIDARFLTHPQHGGFKTYTENLVAALARLDRENDYVLYLDREPVAGDLIPQQSNFQTRIVPGSLPMIGVPWREQVLLSRQATVDRVDLFHAPCLTAPLYLSCPLVITVHDMIWAFPERFSQKAKLSLKRKFMEWYNYYVPEAATRRASAILTVSHAAENDIRQLLKVPAEKITVTWEAARSSFWKIEDQECLETTRKKYDLHSKFILAIGSADPRKNISALVQAYSLLHRTLQEKYHLAVVWTHTHLAEAMSHQIAQLGIEGQVHFLQNVSNEELVHLYNSASLFVFPSLYEGFGLPILEAMACGTPVVAARNSSIPEITGDAALLFDPENVQQIAETITYILSRENVGSALIQNGLARSALFSWEKCAAETLSVYREVLLSKDNHNP